MASARNSAGTGLKPRPAELPGRSQRSALSLRERAPVRLIRATVIAGAVLIPLFIAIGHDAFRFPKEMAIRFEAIVIVSIAAITWITKGGIESLLPQRNAVLMVAVIAGWSMISFVGSTNKGVSLRSMIWIITAAAIYLATVAVLRAVDFRAALVPLIASLINGLTVILQEREIWSPVQLNTQDPFLTRTGFIGNPNDVGAYLVICTVPAVVAALVSPRWRRITVPATVILICSVIASHSVTAIFALVTGLLTIAALRSKRTLVLTSSAVIVSVVVAAMVYTPLRERYGRMQKAVVERNYDALLSYRSTPFIAAALMVADRPLLGVGPGCFGWMYYEYKLKAEARIPALIQSGARAFNFGETHSDHLQILAQTGVPGYALFIGVLLYIGSISFRMPPATDERSAFVRTLALPFAVTFAVLTLAQFPLELVAPSHTLFYIAALLEAWRTST